MVQQVTGYSAFISSGGMQGEKELANCPEDTIVVSRTVVAIHSDGVSTRDLEALDGKVVVESSSEEEEKGVVVRDEKGWRKRPSLSTRSSFTQYVREGSFLSLSTAQTRSP